MSFYKVFLFILLTFFVTIFPKEGLAESYLKYGVGVFNSASNKFSETKAISLGYRDRLLGPFVYQYGGGIWIDSAGNGRKGSGVFDISIGIEAVSKDLVLRSAHGIATISTPDAYLGGYFPNFVHDLYVGMRDQRGVAIGLSYRHISNAGLMSPNMGRDFLFVDLGIPW